MQSETYTQMHLTLSHFAIQFNEMINTKTKRKTAYSHSFATAAAELNRNGMRRKPYTNTEKRFVEEIWRWRGEQYGNYILL